MKIYLAVRDYHYEGIETLAAFTRQDTAVAFCNTQKVAKHETAYLEVHEYETDRPEMEMIYAWRGTKKGEKVK